MTQAEGSRWIQAAGTDLKAVEILLAGGYFHLCAFHAQQAAEKALKGLLRLFGRVPWGHSCFDLITEIDGVFSSSSITSNLFAAVQRLDGHYVPSRYPDAFPSGVPSDHYDEPTARQAIDDARATLKFVVGNKP